MNFALYFRQILIVFTSSLPVHLTYRQAIMDLTETALQEQAVLEHEAASKSLALAQVLDSQAIASSGGSLAHFTVSHTSQGLAVLHHSTLDGTSTVTSLPGFTLSSFDAVDVAVKPGDSQDHELAVAHCTVGVDGRFVCLANLYMVR